MHAGLWQAGLAALLLGSFATAPVAATNAPAVTAPRAAACALDGVTRDAWHLVATPPGTGPWSVGMAAGDPCVLVAATTAGLVYRSADGGTSWQHAYTHTEQLGAVFGEHLDGALVVAGAAGDRILVSRDGGRTFGERLLAGAPPPGVEDLGSEVVAVTLGGSDLYVARRAERVDGLPEDVSSPTLFQGPLGLDAPLRPVGESAALAPVAISWDGTAGVLVVGDERAEPSGGVWMLAAGTLEQALGVAHVTDVVVTPLTGAGRAIYAATETGLYDSVDGGSGWGQTVTGPVYGIRPEWGAAGVVMTLTGPRRWPSRSNDAGDHLTGRSAGLPAGCVGDSLRRTTTMPSYFLLSCADGRTFRYVAAGADFTGSLPPAGGDTRGRGDPGYDPIRVTEPMKPLRSWPLDDGETSSGSIAFDGYTLYYSDANPPCGGLSTEIFRVDARTGRPLDPIETDVGAFALDVDKDTRTLFAAEGGTYYRVPLGGGPATVAWRVPRGLYRCDQFSWDPTLKVFWGFGHSTNDIFMVDRRGHLVSRCTWGNRTGLTFSGPYTFGAAAIAAAGDGSAYLELEDDETVLRLSRKCSVIAAFQHPRYSEVTAENDAMTCDTNTFPESAIWIRDGDKSTVTAYEVPGAFCPLPTAMTLTGPARLDLLGQALVCGTLRLPWGPPLPGMDVALFADTVPLGSGRTDAAGRICATYVPSLDHPPLARGPGRKPLLAVFLGNKSYRASSARGALDVVSPPAPPPVPLPARPAPVPAELPPAQPIQQPAPHAQAEVNQAQSQAQAQAQAQAQPVAQAHPNAVVVVQPQEQPQLAYVADDTEAAHEYEMSALRRERPVPGAPYAAAAAAVSLAICCAFAYGTAKARDG